MFACDKETEKICWRTGTMFPLADWTLNSGACNSSRKARGWAVQILRSSSTYLVLWIALVSSSACVLYFATWRGMYELRWSRFDWGVPVSSRRSVAWDFEPDDNLIFCLPVVCVLLAPILLCVATCVPSYEPVGLNSELLSISLASSVSS